MTWTAPKTWATNDVLLAAELNMYLRDNLLELSPAKATTPGSIFTVTAPNLIAERIPVTDFIATSESTASTSYVDLATVGPTVTCETTSKAIVFTYCHLLCSTGDSAWMSYEVTGATDFQAPDHVAVMLQNTGGQRAQAAILHGTLVPGINTFTAQYRVTAGTGTWSDRRIMVLPF